MTTRSFDETASFSRPANTTAYADGDGVSDDATTPTAATFKIPDVARTNGMGGEITDIYLHKDDQDTTNADFTVYLFDTLPAVAGFNDNAAIAITDAEFQNCIGFVVFGNADAENVVTGDNWHKSNLNIRYRCAAADNSLYFVVVARAAYTPASGETFTLRFKGRVG